MLLFRMLVRGVLLPMPAEAKHQQRMHSQVFVSTSDAAVLHAGTGCVAAHACRVQKNKQNNNTNSRACPH
jgi:hypothetical protein